MADYEKWRKDIEKMSDGELDFELSERRCNWYEMVIAEALRRLLKQTKKDKMIENGR